MKRLALWLGVVCALAFASSTHAAKPAASLSGQLDLSSPTGYAQTNSQIEKQSWFLAGGAWDPDHTVVNSTACSWDINDHSQWQAMGDLAAGASVSTSFCHVMDFNPIFACKPMCANWSGFSNWIGWQVGAKGAGIVASICFAPQGRCFTPAVIDYGRGFSQTFCGQAVYAGPQGTDSAVVPIANSNGGYGVVTTATLSVTNSGSHLARGVAVLWGLASDQFYPTGCSNPDHSPQAHDYPFNWSV